MAGLKEWFEEAASGYDPTVVIVEVGNPIPEMVIQEVQLKNCYWKDGEENVSETVSFTYEEAKMIGKKHRIRTFSAEQINEALNKEGIFTINRNAEITQINSDEVE